MESSVVMTHLADLLNRVTLPLQNLERRRKEAEDELKAIDAKPEEPAAAEPPPGSPQTQSQRTQALLMNPALRKRRAKRMSLPMTQQRDKRREIQSKRNFDSCSRLWFLPRT
ncbi:hypothetical protein NXS19_000762 [Fusarium pseudograminearum]|nr:hypothetical protein NXS19_000762 [Fusarium pseudograminearum]